MTRTDNLVSTRQLYNTGIGTAGVTIYASDANMQITEAEYLDAFFVLQAGVRRPSFDVYYNISCPLPIEILNFDGEYNSGYNKLKWSCAAEINNKYFSIERSIDAINYKEIAQLDGALNSSSKTYYSYNDDSFEKRFINYYRLKQVDVDGSYKYFNVVAIDDKLEKIPTLIKKINLFGQEVANDHEGVYIEIYSDGSYVKKCCNIKQQ